MKTMEYVYLGDRMTRPEFRNARCRAVRRPDGKCIRGRNGNMLVEFESGLRCVVLGRRLRRLDKSPKVRRCKYTKSQPNVIKLSDASTVEAKVVLGPSQRKQ